MTWPRLIRAEMRKLTTTRMPWAFLMVLVAISGLTAIAVILGTDMDGSKAFIATADDQQSLVAFAVNAMMGASLFGAIAVAREYAHGTVVPTYLTEPRRHRAMLAQLTAVILAGSALSVVGAALTVGAVAAALPMTEYGFMVSTGGVAQVIAASAFAGAIGALLGAGIGAVVRNTGGAVTLVFLVLIMLPPLTVQLTSAAGPWVPGELAAALSGVGGDVGVLAALAALAAWGLLPAAVGVGAVLRRDVV